MSLKQDVSHITGNVSDEVKQAYGNPADVFLRRGSKPSFGESILKRMVVTEISVEKKVEEPQKLEGRFVCELTIEDDMVNGLATMHGGCSALLVDVCSTLALASFHLATTGDDIVRFNVSQSLNMVYHSPAELGDRIRIVNTTMTVGARALSARTEIWNLTHHRLVCSGVHIKMQASQPKVHL